jgi:hypothetical protein
MHPDAGPIDNGQVTPPMLGPIPASTYWPTVLVHGRGPGGGSILIQSSAAGAQTVSVPACGNFCAEVPLLSEAVNQLEMRAMDRFGNVSDPIDATVRQHGTPPNPPTTNDSYDSALGGSATTNMHGSDDPASMIDGSMTTTYTGWVWFRSGTWAWVQLGARSTLARLHIRSPSDCPAKDFTAYISDRDAPGEPEDTNMNWTAVAHVSSSNGDDTLPVSRLTAKHVALLFTGDGSCLTWWPPGASDLEITEIEAWTDQSQAQPPQDPPHCGDGC